MTRLAAWFLTASVVVTSLAARSQDPSSAVQPVELFLRLDRNTYTLNDRMVFDVGLINQAPDTIYVFRPLPWGYGLSLIACREDQTASDKDGRAPLPAPPLRRVDDLTILVRLGSHEMFGARESGTIRSQVQEPGLHHSSAVLVPLSAENVFADDPSAASSVARTGNLAVKRRAH